MSSNWKEDEDERGESPGVRERREEERRAEAPPDRWEDPGEAHGERGGGAGAPCDDRDSLPGEDSTTNRP
jgi:hypothetical protein